MLIRNWRWSAINNLGLEHNLIEQLHQVYPGDLPQVKIATKANLDRLTRQSEDYRVYIRGEVGKLG